MMSSSAYQTSPLILLCGIIPCLGFTSLSYNQARVLQLKFPSCRNRLHVYYDQHSGAQESLEKINGENEGVNRPVPESTVGPICVVPDNKDFITPSDQVSTAFHHQSISLDEEVIDYHYNTDTTAQSSYVNRNQKYVFSEDSSIPSLNGFSSKADPKTSSQSSSFSVKVTGVVPNPTITMSDSYSTKAEQGREFFNRAIENVIMYLPVVAPLLAYNTFTNVSWLYTHTVEFLSSSRWTEVDGGMYSTKILTPAINGIVVPSVSILFATLVSSTVTTLRTRQLDIRTSLNKEANNIRMLQSMIDSFPIEEDEVTSPVPSSPTLSEYQDKCRAYLTQYVVRLIAESQDGVNINTLEYTGSVDSEMNALTVLLNELSHKSHSAQLMQSSPSLLSEAYNAVSKLNEDRSIRISALQSTFPPLHYLLIALLGSAIMLTFLIESAEAPNLFLNEVQLQLLWTILIGTFSALGTVLYDLSDPFRGSYQISPSRRQLYTIRDSLKASARMKREAEQRKKFIQQRSGIV